MVTGIDANGEAPVRVGIVRSYFRHQIIRAGVSKPVSHIIARVKWYMDHPRRDYINPQVIICATTFDPDSPASFVPVNRIAGRVAIARTKLKFDYGEDAVTIAIPQLKTE